MQNYFFAGPDLVHWDLQLVRADNRPHVRLTVTHSQGEIIEYFQSAEAALEREREIEDLLIAARSRGAQPDVAVLQ